VACSSKGTQFDTPHADYHYSVSGLLIASRQVRYCVIQVLIRTEAGSSQVRVTARDEQAILDD
jgi:hypothetical protein